MLDLEGNELEVGDECWVAFSNSQLLKIKIVKESDKTIHYMWQIKQDSTWSKKKKGDWSNKTYMLKSSQSFKNMLKC